MKDGTSMSNHLSEFNSVFDQVSGQGIELNDSLKALFLLITLPDSWDTFRTTVSTNTAADGLSYVTVEASLVIEEVNRVNNETSKNGSALVVRVADLLTGTKARIGSRVGVNPGPETWNVTIFTRRVT